ncbi:hypothetical protein Ahia01_001035700 [Argonauta hians]
MSFFRWRKKSLNISEADPVYKVRYLGNIHTCMMKGEGCVDKPASILWNNYLQSSHQALDMKIVVSVSGIKAFTKEQGLMQYSSHKISYILAHPQYPRMFLWVYRHEGRKMKLDLRCHAVLCKSEAKAKLLNVQLHDKLSFALKEFVRDKRRKHNSRLIFEKTNAELSNGSILPLRQQMLCQGGKFKPPVSKMNSAPKLGSIYELDEREEERMSEVGDVVEYEEIEEERMEELTKQLTNNNVFMNPKQNITHCEEEEDEEGIGGMNDSIDGEDDDDDDEDDDDDDDDDDLCTESDMSDGIDSLALDPESDNVSMCSDHVCPADTLKRDEIHFLLNKKKKSDSDGESSESGFSDSSKEIGLYRVDDNEKPSEECQGSNHGGGITQCDKDIHCPNNNNNNNNGSCDKSTTTTTTTTTIATNGNTTTTTKGSSRRHHNRNKNTRDGSETQYLHPKNTTTTTTTNNNCKTKPNGNSNNNNNNNSHIESPLRTTTTTTTNQSNSLSTSSSSSTSPSLLPSKSSSSSSSTTSSSPSCTTRTTRTALSPKSSKFNQQLNNSGKSPSSPSQTSSSSSVSSSIRDVTKMVRLL